jgi:hypothetical protein
MQPNSRQEEQPAEPRKDVKERKRRFQIVKLEERIAPGGGGNGKHSLAANGCGNYTHHCRY